MNPVAVSKCQIADPCIYCTSGMGHPPLAVVYDPREGAYAESPDVICIARWESTGRGYVEDDICGSPATRWAGDVPLCDRHYKRLVKWVAEEDIRDHEVAMEQERVRHDQAMRHEEEMHHKRVELERKRIRAHAEAKSPHAVVYYIRRTSDGMIKIGTTGSLAQRMTTLRRDHGPLQILLVLGGDRDEEAEAHLKFKSYRIGRTEWFRPARPVLEWIWKARQDQRPTATQPANVLPLDELGGLVRAAPQRKHLRWEGGILLWPPELAVA